MYENFTINFDVQDQQMQEQSQDQAEDEAGLQRTVEDEIQNLRTAFGLLDRDRDGQVSAEELQQMLEDLGIQVREDLIVQLLAQAGDSGASLTESEFLQWIARIEDAGTTTTDSQSQEEAASQDLIAAFRVFDRDSNGFITLDELRSAMEMIGEAVSEAELGAMLNMADIDQDGRINYEEFARLLS